MLDRGLETRLIDSCLKNNLAVMAYSPLEQGLLTGKITMESVFDEKEKRSSIPWMKPVNRIKVINIGIVNKFAVEEYPKSQAAIPPVPSVRIFDGGRPCGLKLFTRMVL